MVTLAFKFSSVSQFQIVARNGKYFSQNSVLIDLRQ